MKEWFTPLELADLCLASLPSTTQCVSKKAEKESWRSRNRSGQGGGKEYHVSSLPLSAREELARRELNNVVPIKTRSKAITLYKNDADLSQAKGWQRETAEARAAVLAEIDRLALSCGKNAAIQAVISGAKYGTLEPHFMEIVKKANAKSGAVVRLSRASIFNWYNDVKKAGLQGLVPTASLTEKVDAPEWFKDFSKYYFRPQKPSLQAALEDMAKDFPRLVPTYRQAKFYLDKIGKLLANKGRVWAREGKAFRAYVARDTSNLWPGAIYSSDGHTFDAEIAHPVHGKAFRPEVTTIIDVYTRKAVGYSLNVAESTWSVMDAMRHAVTTNGVPDIFYVDNGNGFNNTVIDMFCARLGITKKNSIAYNSQARGQIERLHQTIWVRAAKRLPTYMGAAMDPEAKQKVFKIVRKETKQDGRSKALPDWRGFMEYCDKCYDEYNNHPHSSLPIIFDNETGKKRHMTPNEMWERGNPDLPDFYPETLTQAETDDLARPYEVRKCMRCMVNIFDNFYTSPLLAHYHEEKVAVGFDIHDPMKVWVRELDTRNVPGKLICVAAWEGNKKAYMPISVAEHKEHKRLIGQLKRNEAHAIEFREALGQPVLPAPIAAPITDEEAAKTQAFLQEFEAEQNVQPVVDIDTPAARFRKAIGIKQKIEKGESIDPEDRRWFEKYSTFPEYIQRMDFAQDFGLETALTA